MLLDQSAGPVDLQPVRGEVSAILFSAANGERQGLAAADVIFGRVDPSGHLSFTWYADDRQLPPKNDYNLTPDGSHGLGRTYMYFAGRPAYPFGYGSSYTTFRFARATVNRRRLPVTGTLRVSVRVTNTGRRAGATVAQVYAVPPPHTGLALPRKLLVGFARTRVLRPHGSQTLTMAVPLIDTLRHWNAALGREVVPDGIWRFRVARSSVDPIASIPVRLTGTIPREIATVAVAPPVLSLPVGQSLDLRGRNPWLQGLAPNAGTANGDTIISAARRDDSFVDLTGVRMTFRSDHPNVLRAASNGVVTAVAPGVATITVTAGGRSASTPFVAG